MSILTQFLTPNCNISRLRYKIRSVFYSSPSIRQFIVDKITTISCSITCFTKIGIIVMNQIYTLCSVYLIIIKKFSFLRICPFDSIFTSPSITRPNSLRHYRNYHNKRYNQSHYLSLFFFHK